MTIRNDELAKLLEKLVEYLQEKNLLPKELDKMDLIEKVITGLDGVELTKDQLLTPHIQKKLMVACIAAFVEQKVSGFNFNYQTLFNPDSLLIPQQKELLNLADELKKMSPIYCQGFLKEFILPIYEQLYQATKINDPNTPEPPEFALLRQGIYDDAGHLLVLLPNMILGLKGSPSLMSAADISQSEFLGSGFNQVEDELKDFLPKTIIDLINNIYESPTPLKNKPDPYSK